MDERKEEMKTFIYFSQGEWRTFQAEELPVKPEFKGDYFLHYGPQRKYESEIATLKAKSLKVGNPEVIKGAGTVSISSQGETVHPAPEKFYQWPGTVEVKEELEYPIDHTSYPPYIEVAILKLPNP